MIIVLVVLAAALVFAGLQLSKTTGQVTVPEVTTLPVAQASDRLAADGFEVDVRE